MCRMDEKRIGWYIRKNLVENHPIDKNGYVLKFKPGGLGHHGESFYMSESRNICVVCGSDKNLIRTYIIPHHYRKHLPPELKEYDNHDIILLCNSCKLRYDQFSGAHKRYVCRKYGIPPCSLKVIELRGFKKVKSFCSLLHLNLHVLESSLEKESKPNSFSKEDMAISSSSSFGKEPSLDICMKKEREKKGQKHPITKIPQSRLIEMIGDIQHSILSEEALQEYIVSQISCSESSFSGKRRSSSSIPPEESYKGLISLFHTFLTENPSSLFDKHSIYSPLFEFISKLLPPPKTFEGLEHGEAVVKKIMELSSHAEKDAKMEREGDEVRERDIPSSSLDIDREADAEVKEETWIDGWNEFAIEWRDMFVDKMQPEYLKEDW
ncbi:Exosome complex exonuclease Rrp6-like protein [Aduncisulcus paluster]|uniref:Exosome complex exonuclease Rrp6-like protein n=1 Tax=Aduncisulcus paluster TaxID=2918883 RepID=A0ABQ5KXE7_9EUKA|nr:Exosome complex exonuclease Rrp6-like protein [Aduncisulcus paluster]